MARSHGGSLADMYNDGERKSAVERMPCAGAPVWKQDDRPCFGSMVRRLRRRRQDVTQNLRLDV
jgi:hypothetical protein